MRIRWAVLMAALLAASCGSNDSQDTASIASPTATLRPTSTATPSAIPTATASPTPTDPLVVMTDKGAVRGASTAGVRQFLGIPYAAAPMGDLRWRPPVPAAAWSATRNATKAGNVCPQTVALVGSPTGSEDCLFVNVFAPDPPPAAPAPVMVWIHGGGFTSGDGLNSDATDGSVMVQRAGIVVVTLNYRLGQLGFLAHRDLTAEDPAHPSSGNYGIEDQIAALHWVHDNIGAFGGDPANVTIFGESAGGWSVGVHLTSQLSAGLFQRAIIESGPCLLPFPTLAAAEKQGDLLASRLGCDGAADALACLRGKSATEVINTLPRDPTFLLKPGEWGSWEPNIDQYLLERQIGESFDAGLFNHTPILAGSNRDEGSLFAALAHDINDTPAQYPGRVKFLVKDDATVAQVVAQYPLASYASPFAALAAVFGDGFLACPTLDTAEKGAASVPVYLYQFLYPDARYSLPFPISVGAYHGAEIQFVFRQPLGGVFTAAQLQLSDRMMDYWTRFAATGDPNGASAPAWPRYDAAAAGYLSLDLTIAAAEGPKAATCAFWRGLTYLRPPLTE